MNTLVVYDSVYGNTRAIAHAIAGANPADVPVRHIDEVNRVDLDGVDLLFIGSPTYGSMPTDTVQSFLQRIGGPARAGAVAATFDTRLTWRFLRRFGFAADKIADTLSGQGWTVVGEPGGFFVRGLKKGPLKKGEADRAAAWAKTIIASRA